MPQYLAVYLGAGWGLVEFMSFLEDRYAIAPAWTDLSLLTWALLIPSVLVFTYHHGRPGRDQWARSELIAIPANVLVVIVVLTMALTSRDLSATVRKVTLTDETGATTDRVVASPQHRKRLAVFYFDAAPADTAVQWLKHAAPTALVLDLSQDIFLDMRTPPEFRKQLQEAGVPDGHGLSLAAQRRIAEELHLPYFVTGRVASEGGDLSISVVVHEVATGRQLGEQTVTGPDMLTLVDQLSLGVKQALRVPQRAEVRDLDVAELLSTNPAAVRAVMGGQAAASRDDWVGAEGYYARAVELDPTFALAHFGLYIVRSMLGNSQAALEPLARALQHEYRLPERTRFRVKIEHFIVNRDMDKAYAVAKMTTELYPDDLQGHTLRAQLETFRDDKPAAIASLSRMVDLDPQQSEVLFDIARLQEQLGEYDAAIGTYDRYAKRFPQDARVQVRLGRAYAATGRLEEAAAAFDGAIVRDPGSTEALVEQAALLRHTGDAAGSLRLLQQARGMARSVEDRVRVLSGLQSHYQFTGQLGRAIETGWERVAAVAEFQPPALVRSQQMRLLPLYVKAGRRVEADSLLETVRRQMAGELGEFWRLGQLEMAVESRDTTQLVEGIAGVRKIIDDFGFRVLEPELVRGEAVLFEERGAWTDALQAWQRLAGLEPSQLSVGREVARVYRHLGRQDDALRALEAHLRAAPFAPESNLEAARVRLARGDVTGAHGHLTRAASAWTDADPAYASAAELRALLQRPAN